MFVLLTLVECSSLKVKTCSAFSAFCQSTFYHALILHAVMYPERGIIPQMYHNQDSFDFSQGHVTKNKPMTGPV